MAVFHPKRELWEAVVAAAAQLEDEWRLENLVAALGTRRACVEPGPVALGGLRVRSWAVWQLGGNLALQGLALFVQQMSPQEKNHKYLPCEINPTRTN